MENTTYSAGGTSIPVTLGPAREPPVARESRSEPTVSTYLGQLEEVRAHGASPEAKEEFEFQQHLVQMRLGVAGGLYSALRVKHPATAAHCLRVAMGCSSWAQQLKMSDAQRDEIEVAALLHDIGKIGVPDYVLSKPCKLEGDEILAMDRARIHARTILSGFCTTPGILENVQFCPAWYDGRKHGYDLRGDQLPLGARIIAIVDAFDSMTTDSVYRKAYSRERAVGELFGGAGTQFDPALVQDFCHFLELDPGKLGEDVARHWLRDLNPDVVNAHWRLSKPVVAHEEQPSEQLFMEKMLESIRDGVIFIDHGLRIILWNRAAERLTGISPSSVLLQHWTPLLVGLRDEHGQEFCAEDCPAAFAIASGVQTLRRLSINNRNKEKLSVDVHLVPVIGREGSSHGVAIVMRDASRTITLEERVESLHELATRDALTQVGNRAEFDRMHAQFVERHLETGDRCSLVICDIDHFKKINDTFGHQAGDAALIAFAGLLRGFCRNGDVVARYGGEEFALLCADCDNATAMTRAEEIRRRLAAMAQPALNGKCMTASFGVTEVQGGDTPETMLRRADRALYQAKENGRNMVVQLGSGIVAEPVKKTSGWLSWFVTTDQEKVLEQALVTPVPLNIAAEKLRGFVSDQHAVIESIEQNHVVLRIEGTSMPLMRRQDDRAVPFCIELQFQEREIVEENRRGPQRRTVIHVTIRPKRQRDRRRQDMQERARMLLISLKSYLMAQELVEPAAPPPTPAATVEDKTETAALRALKQSLRQNGKK